MRSLKMSKFLNLVMVMVATSSTTAMRECNIVDWGAVGDATTSATEAIIDAVEACGADGAGGRIVIPFDDSSRGLNRFLTGSFELLYDHLEFHIEAGATLLGSTLEDDYPLIPILPSYGTGRDVDSEQRYRPLIFASNVTRLSLTGGGVVDGQGETWWVKHFARQLLWSRPRLVECMYCTDVLIEDLTFQNSPFWTIHPYASQGVTVRRVTVTAPGWAPNTDGVDPDSCRDVLIQDCVFKAGDDGVAIKSGLNEYGRSFGMPSENIRVENTTVEPEFDNGSTNGVSIGSEMSGGVRNVTVDGLFVANCAVGVYIKSMDGRGGVVEDISFRNVVAEQVIEPIRFAMDYTYRRRRRLGALEGDGGDDGGGDDDDTTPYFRNLSVINLTATRAVVAGTFEGLPASQIEGVYLKDVTVTGKDPGSTQRGRQEGPQFDGPEFKCRNASGIAIRTAPGACF
mmetsp:Transcript_71903/g.203687  ORF Transcript_71903/g.203687 Transcript_71903/m.203687 type:complete len:455 (-) Transcript_71903:844-2208(-)